MAETKQSVFKEVDKHKKTNNFAHHTKQITVEDLIVRRGQFFKVTLSLTKPFNHFLHPLHITAVTGVKENASEDQGTMSVFGIPDPQDRSPSAKAVWKIELDKSSTALTGKLVLNITPPADAPIGLWKLRAKYMEEETCLAMPYVLFNPWCKEDTVYLKSPKQINEYVMNERGTIYRGSRNYIKGKAWDYSQFEKDMVVIGLALLDNNHLHLEDPAKDVASRSDPIYVSRVISAMINSEDDRGVLEGRWGGPYWGGQKPTHWNGSYPILKKWLVSDCHPVKYGQCWVFAGVMCSVMRLLGIPCRVITNFDSAHDTDMNLVIDVHHADFGVDEVPNRDSVWNFHVWTEAWMKRPNLPKMFSGWQVVDPTPQELSDGVCCCGPAPVKAIKEGELTFKYDIPFIFAEVNADCIEWRVKKDGTKVQIYSDTAGVGHYISTKAVNSDDRLDVTDKYKYPEGSEKEKEIRAKAKAKDYPIGVYDMEIEEPEEEDEEMEEEEDTEEAEDTEGNEEEERDAEEANENTENTVDVEETEGPDGDLTEEEDDEMDEEEESGGTAGAGGTEEAEESVPPVVMKFKEVSRPTNGKNVRLKLLLESKSSVSRQLSINISVQAINYDGHGSKNIHSEKKEKTLQPGKVLTIPIRVLFSDYHMHMVDADIMKISVMVEDKDYTDLTYLAVDDVVLEDPPITVTVQENVRLYRIAQGEVIFANPVEETLTNCHLTLSGSGVWKDEIEIKVPDLKKNNRMRSKFYFTPTKAGETRILVDFDCATFRDIQGMCKFIVN